MLATNATSLIAEDNVWGLWALILIGVALSIYLEQSYRWAAKLSGPVIALLIAMLLSNLAILPMTSPTYDVITDYLVPIAVSLLLFRASLMEIVSTSRMAFLAMQLAIVATVTGTFCAAAILSNWESATPVQATSQAMNVPGVAESHSSFLAELPEISGMMAASYAGGGVNFFAVKEIYKINEGLTSSLLVADNFVMAAAFLAMFALASMPFLRRHYPHPHSLDAENGDAVTKAKEHWQAKQVSLLDLAAALAIAGGIAATSTLIAQTVSQHFSRFEGSSHSAFARLALQIGSSLAASKFVWVTLITIAAATLFGKSLRRIGGTEQIGGYLLYLFLFSIGLPSDFLAVIRHVPVMFLLCLIIASFNLVLTLVMGKLFRMNLEELLLASNASLGGPASAAAMAVSMGWNRLVTTGLLIGLWGYVVGTAVGVTVTEVLRQFFPGA